MSNNTRIKKRFNIPAHITGQNMQAGLHDEFVMGFKIFDLPESLGPEHFQRKFAGRALAEYPGFPTTVWQTCNDTALNMMNGSEYARTYIQVAFKQPVDHDFTKELLEDVIFDVVEENGMAHGYSIDSDHDCDWQQIVAAANKERFAKLSSEPGHEKARRFGQH